MRSLVRVQDGPPASIQTIDGGLAQLVERLLCKQDVSGSSPLTSTENDSATSLVSTTREPAGFWSSQNLENCIETCQVGSPIQLVKLVESG